MSYLLHQTGFVFRFRYYSRCLSFLRSLPYLLLGMRVGKGTALGKLYITWPHKVKIGSNCSLEYGIFFKYDGIWNEGVSIHINDRVFVGQGCEFNIRQRITIGNDTLIASGCKFIDHDHGTSLEKLMRLQEGAEQEITIGSNVWLGCNVVVLKGVVIGDGAVVAAGAVVTKSIRPNEIWAGVPARKIGDRE